MSFAFASPSTPVRQKGLCNGGGRLSGAMPRPRHFGGGVADDPLVLFRSIADIAVFLAEARS